MPGGPTTEHAEYNNVVINSLSFAKYPLEALDSNGGTPGAWRELNSYARNDYTGTTLCTVMCTELNCSFKHSF